MRNTTVLGVPGEWFIPWNPEDKSVNWLRRVPRVESQGRSANGVTAVKIMANQAGNVDKCLSAHAEGTQGLWPFFAATFKNAKWIFLRRNNVVEQAISRVMAKQTSVNHATSGTEHFAGKTLKGYDKQYNSKVTYSYDEILQAATAVTLENIAWDRFFDSHRIKPLRLFYEDTAFDERMSHLDEISALVGLGNVRKEPRQMVKLANEKNREWKERFFIDAEKNRFRPIFRPI
ncbi:Stf0 family sulfotransferase [Roseisalinus antarcticus]